MSVLVDTHVHIYESYALDRAVEALAAHLTALAPDAVRAAVVVWREGCRSLEDLARAGYLGGALDTALAPGDEPGVVLVRQAGVPVVTLVAGQQYVTRERIEVLALTVALSGLDGLPAAAVIDAVLEAGGVPLIPWSPGKWSLARGAVVGELIRRYGGDGLLLGDTTLRPRCWPEPRLMREARRRGVAVLAGSDPLPFPGEERWLGRYAARFDRPFDGSQPLASLRALFHDGAGEAVCAGERRGAASVVWRVAGLVLAKRRQRARGLA